MSLVEVLKVVDATLDGTWDNLPEEAFNNISNFQEALEKTILLHDALLKL